MKIDETMVVQLVEKNQAEEAYNLIKSIWKEFRAMAGENKGQIIDLKNDNEAASDWITVEKYKADYPRRNECYQVFNRVSILLKAFKLRTRPTFKFRVDYEYLGNGKAVFFWRYKDKKLAKFRKDASQAEVGSE